MIHHKAAALDTSKRLEPPIEHERERCLRRIEVRKRAFNGNAATTKQIVCKITRQIDTRGSKGDLNVSEIAAAFGGGGHPAAAGFSNNGTILETLTAALPMLAELVGEDPASVTVEL